MSEPLLVVGSLALDTVETPFGKREEGLGGSATYVSTAAAHFCPVRLVGVVGEDFPSQAMDHFRARNIDVAGLQRDPGKTFRWSGYYDHDLSTAHTRSTCLNAFEHFRGDLPESFRDTCFAVLGNIDPDIQRRVLEQLRNPKLVVADTMNYWIDGSRPALLRMLKRVQMLSVNDAEARQLSGEYNLVRAAAAIRRMGPDVVLVKRGEHGAMVFMAERIFIAPAFPVQSIQDPTGAGDTFAGGCMGYIARRGDYNDSILRQAVIMGSVMASFTVEEFGLDRLLTVTDDEIRLRFGALREITYFEAGGTTLWA
jgi:sugar/nucleoside kinase (ribokinase family)